MDRILRKLIFIPALTAAFAVAAIAQDTKVEDRPQEPQKIQANQPQDVRGNMLRQLGLSRDQIQGLRRVNSERKPLMDAAQTRLRAATRALDEAIYADEVNDADVQARLKEMQLAQAEVFKIRTMNEIAVRRLLTPEQLVRFRAMRQRFEQVRENGANGRRMNGDAPMRNANQFKDTKQPVKPAIKPNKSPEL
jgi:Spy/CpxP family protein refolding chaperone